MANDAKLDADFIEVEISAIVVKKLPRNLLCELIVCYSNDLLRAVLRRMCQFGFAFCYKIVLPMKDVTQPCANKCVKFIKGHAHYNARFLGALSRGWKTTTRAAQLDVS